MAKTCVICGKPSGMYPLCAEHLKAKNEGTVVKCEECKTWHYVDKPCKCKDPYEMFLSGSESIVIIENPNSKTDKELIIFRDSFGSSLAPLFAEGYKKITVFDIRYMLSSSYVSAFANFENSDVLFIYSTALLNNSTALKP